MAKLYFFKNAGEILDKWKFDSQKIDENYLELQPVSLKIKGDHVASLQEFTGLPTGRGKARWSPIISAFQNKQGEWRESPEPNWETEKPGILR